MSRIQLVVNLYALLKADLSLCVTMVFPPCQLPLFEDDVRGVKLTALAEDIPLASGLSMFS